MIRYVVTIFPTSPGANLARLGDWGGMNFPTVLDAERAALDDANGRPFTIDHERASRPLKEA